MVCRFGFVRLSLSISIPHQALDAFHEAVLMFDEQLILHEHQQDAAFPHEKRALKDNYEILQKRLKMLHAKQEELAQDLRKVSKPREKGNRKDVELSFCRSPVYEVVPFIVLFWFSLVAMLSR